MFYLYNSLTRQKEIFKPISKNKVLIYVCGITPYDTTHIGHAFTYIVFDVLVRYLKFKKFEVNYVQNVTDIDDDILKKAKEEKKNWKQLGEYWTKRFLKDTKNLNLLFPTHYIKATDSIEQMINLIKVLTKKKFTYKKNGNVYFEISKFISYGKLSKFNRNQMILISKERGGNPTDPFKKNPLDFILWQKSGKDEPFWQSPWGKGKPGWHIECSAMIYKFLGSRIDIHGGGKDLIFPHHENEIAQSESYTGKSPFVKYWMHTSMVLCNGEKMSKSLGNLIMIRDLLNKYSSNEIRWMLLSHHYRSPWEYEENQLISAKININNIIAALKLLKNLKKNNDSGNHLKIISNYLADDLNIPFALDYIEKITEAFLKKPKDAKLFIGVSEYMTILNMLGFNFK